MASLRAHFLGEIITFWWWMITLEGPGKGQSPPPLSFWGLSFCHILDIWWKIRFRIHIIIIQGQMHPIKKSHKKLTVRGGGGSTLTVSLTVKYPFFYVFPISNVGQMITSNLILDCQIEQLDNYGRGLGCLGGNYHQKNSNIRALGQNSPTCWLSWPMNDLMVGISGVAARI